MEQSGGGYQAPGQRQRPCQPTTATGDQGNEGYPPQESGCLCRGLLCLSQCMHPHGAGAKGES